MINEKTKTLAANYANSVLIKYMLNTFEPRRHWDTEFFYSFFSVSPCLSG